jgi:hypothetical protein
MTLNEANWDRALRVVSGLGVISIAFIGPKTPWGYVGLVPLATGLIGWCPLYSVLGFKTCKHKKLETTQNS